MLLSSQVSEPMLLDMDWRVDIKAASNHCALHPSSLHPFAHRPCSLPLLPLTVNPCQRPLCSFSLRLGRAIIYCLAPA